MRALLEYKPFYRLLWYPVSLFMRLKFNYHPEKLEPEHKPYIILSNHTTDYDPIFLGLSVPELVHYVASDHVFRWGFTSRLLKFLGDPIPRLKSATDIQAVKQVFIKLNEGRSVCIFAEGNRSFGGETVDIPLSIGKLVKRSGVSLITYRIDGGYFSSPRWGKKCRKGIVSGRKVSEYSPERIRDMTSDEINQAIREDLYVNAYDEQLRNLIPYYGSDPAENLELALYICPCCSGIGTLRSNKNKFFCSCGFNLKYTPFGLFESVNGNNPPFSTVLEWFRWQRVKIVEKAEQFFSRYPDEPIFFDNSQLLREVDKAKGSKLRGEGQLYLYKDRLELREKSGRVNTFTIESISDMSIYSRMNLIFTTADRRAYEIKTGVIRSAVKYLDVFNYLKSSKAGSPKPEVPVVLNTDR
jgi:1-acyl-sn-glycerol-3-phosphate acyltransferase